MNQKKSALTGMIIARGIDDENSRFQIVGSTDAFQRLCNTIQHALNTKKAAVSLELQLLDKPDQVIPKRNFTPRAIKFFPVFELHLDAHERTCWKIEILNDRIVTRLGHVMLHEMLQAFEQRVQLKNGDFYLGPELEIVPLKKDESYKEWRQRTQIFIL